MAGLLFVKLDCYMASGHRHVPGGTEMAIDLSKPVEIVKRATDLVREAARNNRPLALMSGVTAAGSVVSAVLAMTGSPEVAVFGIAFVIAFMFVLLVFVSVARAKSRSRIILAETLAWSFSLMMVASIGALGTSFFKCWPAPLGTQCKAPVPLPAPVRSEAYQLDEKGMRLDGGEYFLDRATRKSYEDVAYDPAAPTKVAFPVASIIHDYGVRPNGTTEVKVTLLAGDDPAHLGIVRSLDLRNPQQWRALKMADGYPGHADGAAAALQQQHIQVGATGVARLLGRQLLFVPGSACGEDMVEKSSSRIAFPLSTERNR